MRHPAALTTEQAEINHVLAAGMTYGTRNALPILEAGVLNAPFYREPETARTTWPLANS